MKRYKFLTRITLIFVIFSACSTVRKAETPLNNSSAMVPGPKAIIYQTTKDFSQLVPVILSDDGKTIESYPDIKDVFYNGQLAYPTQLHGGFLLDNRGISKNVAFIELTYDAYSKLAVTPTPEQLLKMIHEKQPVTSMYTCGLRSSYKDIVQELNAKIDSGDFSGFIKVK